MGIMPFILLGYGCVYKGSTNNGFKDGGNLID
jgi:hypothetical protein